MAQLVARYLGVVEAARSSRVTQTKQITFATAGIGGAFRHTRFAGMAELADALDSGSSGGNFVEVQVLLPAPPKALKTLSFRGFSLSFFLGRRITTAHHMGLCVCLFFSYASRK